MIKNQKDRDKSANLSNYNIDNKKNINEEEDISININ